MEVSTALEILYVWYDLEDLNQIIFIIFIRSDQT